MEVETEEEIAARSEAAALRRHHQHHQQRHLDNTIGLDWHIDEGGEFGAMPDLELFDYGDDDMISELCETIRERIEKRESYQEENTRVGRIFRKVFFL